MSEFKTLIAGNSKSWSKQLSEYLATDGWELKYSLVNQTQHYEIASLASGDGYEVSITSTVSASWSAGSYRLFGYVSKEGERITIHESSVTIKPNFTSAVDLRSFAEITLEAVEAVIAKTATKDQQQVTVDGQTLARRNIADLILLRDRMKREVNSGKKTESRKRRGHVRRALIRNR